MLAEIRTINNLGDELLVTYACESNENTVNRLLKLKGEEVDIEVKKKALKRSLNANSYFWHLCNEIANVLHSDKDTIYILQLSKYGVFTDLKLNREALPTLKRVYRYVQEFDEGDEETAFVRCYIGSSTYDKEEMKRLIDGTVEDAKCLGIETLTYEELERLKNLWGK